MSTTKQKILAQGEMIPLPTDVGALANRINVATRVAHNKIDKAVTARFSLALKDPKIYRQGLQSFYHVFRTFEECYKQEMAKDTRVAEILRKVWNDDIARTENLKKDLDFFYDHHPEKYAQPIRSKQIEFVQHIKETVAEKPHVLVAYSHVMYLALFAGGRIMRSSLAKTLGPIPDVKEDPNLGTYLFRFNVPDEELLRLSFKREYELATRNDLTEEEKQDIIDEACEIFERNLECIYEIEKHNRGMITRRLAVNSVQLAVVLVLIVVLFIYIKKLSKGLF